MRTTIFLIFILIFSFSVKSQQKPVPDPRLFAGFDKSYLDTTVQSDPQQIEFLNYCLDNSWYITDGKSKENDPKTPELYKIDKENKTFINNSLNDFDFKNINIFEYYFKRNQKTKAIYRIGNTNKYIVFLPTMEVIKNFNEFKRTTSK